MDVVVCDDLIGIRSDLPLMRCDGHCRFSARPIDYARAMHCDDRCRRCDADRLDPALGRCGCDCDGDADGNGDADCFSDNGLAVYLHDLLAACGLQTALKKAYRGYKYKPLDLRIKKTRAIRRKLTIKQATAKTAKAAKKAAYYPLRKYALKVCYGTGTEMLADRPSKLPADSRAGAAAIAAAI
jgi:hypothetical protein